MAESIIIHFSESDTSRVTHRIDENFDRWNETSWHHPKESYLLLITPYKDYEVEYDDEEKKTIRNKLMANPSISFDFEIRRSKSDEACDLLEGFIRNKLMDITFVVDDMEHLYSNSDLEDVNDFLDLYRYKK